MTSWNKSIYFMSDREIVEYYCQIWDNVKHMREYVKMLRNKYKQEIEFKGVK